MKNLNPNQIRIFINNNKWIKWRIGVLINLGFLSGLNEEFKSYINNKINEEFES